MIAPDALARLDGMLSRSESEQAMWEVGYLAGLSDGIATERRVHDRVEAERQLWLGVAKSTLSLPTQAELVRQRKVNNLPCSTGSSQISRKGKLSCRCSRCSRFVAVWCNERRFGSPDYPGVAEATAEDERRTADEVSA